MGKFLLGAACVHAAPKTLVPKPSLFANDLHSALDEKTSLAPKLPIGGHRILCLAKSRCEPNVQCGWNGRLLKSPHHCLKVTALDCRLQLFVISKCGDGAPPKSGFGYIFLIFVSRLPGNRKPRESGVFVTFFRKESSAKLALPGQE